MVDTMTPNDVQRSRRKKTLMVAAAVIGGSGLLIAGGLLWFFGGEAPAEVDLEATASEVSESDGSSSAQSSTEGIEGTWVVDNSVGDFTVEEATTATFVGFRVEEVLNSIGSTTAVGRTPEVSGSMTIDDDALTAAEVVADLTEIMSDEQRREVSIQRSLGTSSNPDAVFVLTEPIELGPEAADGELVEVTAVGQLTVNGVTRDVEVNVDAQLVDGMVLVTGSTVVLFADYDVLAPTSPAVLSVEDNGVIEFQLWLVR